MAIINLKDYYPCYLCNSYIELPDEIVAVMKPYKAEEHARIRKSRRHNACSLDVEGAENRVLFAVMTPEELYEYKLDRQKLYDALGSLSARQSVCLYEYYFLGKTLREISSEQNISISRVSRIKTEALKK